MYVPHCAKRKRSTSGVKFIFILFGSRPPAFTDWCLPTKFPNFSLSGHSNTSTFWFLSCSLLVTGTIVGLLSFFLALAWVKRLLQLAPEVPLLSYQPPLLSCRLYRPFRDQVVILCSTPSSNPSWRQVTKNLEVAKLIFYSTNDKRTDSNR